MRLHFNFTDTVFRNLIIKAINYDNCKKKMSIPQLSFRRLLFIDQQLTIAFPTILDNICGSSWSRSNTPTCNTSI